MNKKGSRLANLHPFADKPKVSIVRSGDDVFEEGRSSVTLRCVADANPPGRVFWRKYGPTTGGNQEEARQYVDTLELKPVTRKDGGTYLCQAENSIGLSNEEPAEIDVQCELNTRVHFETKQV